MFLANSLKEKLKKNYYSNEVDLNEHIKFEYKLPKKDPRQLLSFREDILNLSNEINPKFSGKQLRSLDKKEWENTFTLKKLKNEFNRKTELNFDYKYKKFPDDAILPYVSESKKYVKNLIEPDILELKKKEWDISVDVHNQKRPELKQTIFEVIHGLKDFKVVPLKEKKFINGCDTRNSAFILGKKKWDFSKFISDKEMRSLSSANLFNANENSVKYWRDNSNNRSLQKPFPISENRKKIEVIRYFKPYIIPSKKTLEYNRIMKKVKELTLFDREKAEKKVKYDNPDLEDKYPEKINALVFKEMYKRYLYKYNELTGNLSKEEIKRKQREENKFKWKDEDLIDKILAVKNIKETSFFNKKKMRKSESQDNIRRKILEHLVIKGNEIKNEEEIIKEKIQEEYKIKKKKELLKKPKKNINIIGKIDDSKYPIPKIEYDRLLNESEISSNENDENSNITNNNLNYSEIETKELFIDAYEKIAKNEIEKQEKKNKDNKKNLIFKYHHPGTFREFVYEENIIMRDAPELPEYTVKKKVKDFLWSCCLNSDKNSKGCQKIIYKKNKWIFE